MTHEIIHTGDETPVSDGAIPPLDDLDFSALYPSVMVAHNLTNPFRAPVVSGPLGDGNLPIIFTALMEERVKAETALRKRGGNTPLAWHQYHCPPPNPRCCRCYKELLRISLKKQKCSVCKLSYCSKACFIADQQSHAQVCKVAAIAAHLRD